MGKCLSDKFQIVITCEHGGNLVPERFLPLFENYHNLLNTHRGWDPGAYTLAEKMSLAENAPFFFSTTTRLLIDLNRSNGKKGLFSEATKKLPNAYKRDIIETYYLPYRTHIEHFMQKHIEEGTQIIHLSIHSFTPIWNGEERDCDVGFLYDSSRNPEKCFCSLWLNKLRSVNPSLTLRKNYPYKGTSDGFATYLRKRYAENSYVGIELEVNQKFYFEDAERWEYVSNDIISSLTQALKINCG